MTSLFFQKRTNNKLRRRSNRRGRIKHQYAQCIGLLVGLILTQGAVMFIMYKMAHQSSSNSLYAPPGVSNGLSNLNLHLELPGSSSSSSSNFIQQQQQNNDYNMFHPEFDYNHDPNYQQTQADLRKFHTMLEADGLMPCQWNTGGCHTQQQRHDNFHLVIRNTLSHDRFLCGVKVPADGILFKFPKEKLNHCSSPWTLFQNKPIIHTHNDNDNDNNDKDYFHQFPPIILLFNTDALYGPTEKFTDCNVPCETFGVRDIVSQVFIWKTDWTFTFSMESAGYYPSIKVQPNTYRGYKYFATTSFQSDVPLPYYSNAEYNLQSPAVDFDTAIKGASFLASNCASMSDRESIVAALIQNTPLRVDSLSMCLHNADPPPGVDMNNKADILQHYLFHLAFENSVEKDYITEKLWGTLSSGTVPVYHGAPNAKQHAPPNSIILVEDFKNPKQLADYLIKVANDKQLYNSYHAWRTQPLPQSFHDMYDFTDTHSTCRMCRWAFAKMYGFGWDHNSQTIHDTKISRTNCINSKGLLKHPFKESWFLTPQSSSSSTSFLQQFYSNGNNNAKIRPAIVQVYGNPANLRNANNDNNNNDCFDIVDMNRVLDIEGGLAQRTVWDDNGVTDLHITIQDLHHDGVLMLRLETPIDSHNLIQPSGKYGKKQVLIQDETSRITILTSHEVSTWTNKLHQSGTIEIPVPTLLTKEKDGVDDSSFLFRVRVIVEDVDTFHVGGNHVPNYFGKLLTDDFVHPLETYLAKSLV